MLLIPAVGTVSFLIGFIGYLKYTHSSSHNILSEINQLPLRLIFFVHFINIDLKFLKIFSDLISL